MRAYDSPTILSTRACSRAVTVLAAGVSAAAGVGAGAGAAGVRGRPVMVDTPRSSASSSPCSAIFRVYS